MITYRLEVVPCSIQDARAFVRQHHRHRRPPVSGLFAVAAALRGEVAAVAIVGRPVARKLQDGWTCEVVRLAARPGTPNACSMLYRAAWRAARALGYRRLVSPIKPENAKKYPADWKAIVAKIRERAGGRCECRGECGRDHAGRCPAVNGRAHPVSGSRVVLTTAHLWRGPCAPCDARGEKCGYLDHLAHYCQRCHLYYDLEHHRRNAAATRRAKKERGGARTVREIYRARRDAGLCWHCGKWRRARRHAHVICDHANADGFPDSYVLAPVVGGKPLTQTAQVRMCGNSVPPHVACALARAQFSASVDAPLRPSPACRLVSA